MAAPDDDEPISPEEVRSAVASGLLGAWGERTARLRHWVALTSLLDHLRGLSIPLGALAEAMRTTLQALQSSPPERRRERAAAGQSDVLRTIRMLVGESILSRVRRPAMTEIDRSALRLAATSFNDAGDWARAATAFQEATDFAAAADAWGRLGDLDAMEACLTEDEEQRRTRRIAHGALREIEALVLAGERFAALRLAAAVPHHIDDGAVVRKIVLDLTTRLIRGRGVTLRPVDRPAVRFAGAPAMLGRDVRADVVLRDPGVSRQHARVEAVGGELCVVDAGSRAGTYIAGARLERAFPLRGDVEITLGPSCSIELHVPDAGRVYLRGVSGLDRGLHAAVAVEAIPLVDFWPEAAGTWIEFGEMGARLHHAPETPVRIDGHRASMRVDLLHGETVQIGNDSGDAARPQGPFLLEIE
jgi:hypothetical protein